MLFFSPSPPGARGEGPDCYLPKAIECFAPIPGGNIVTLVMFALSAARFCPFAFGVWARIDRRKPALGTAGEWLGYYWADVGPSPSCI